MNYIIDYFQFVLKPKKFNFGFDDIFELLDISEHKDKFVSYGSKHHYSDCFVWNCIRIYIPSLDRFNDMGFMVELSGQGCRFIEDNFKKKYHTVLFDWKMFALRLRSLVDNDVELNINRIDFAYDDFAGVLDMSVIENAAIKREYVSLFRTLPHKEETHKALEWSQIKDLSEDSAGHTIYFGSKRSNTFCKFYDKLEEQKVKFANNKEKLNALSEIKHWVRFEFTFKRKQANSVVASMCELSEREFAFYLSEVINGYIRFIDRDDSNATRCTVKKWWSDFIGCASRSSLTCPGIPKDPVAGAVAWLSHSLAPTLSALIERFGQDDFISIIESSDPESRYTQKHRDIIESEIGQRREYTAAELWQSYLPDVVLLRIQELRKAGEQLEI